MSMQTFDHRLAHAQGDLGERTISVRTSTPLTPAQWEEIRETLGKPRYTVTEVGEVMPLVLTGEFAEALAQARDLRKKWKAEAQQPARR